MNSTRKEINTLAVWLREKYALETRDLRAVQDGENANKPMLRAAAILEEIASTMADQESDPAATIDVLHNQVLKSQRRIKELEELLDVGNEPSRIGNLYLSSKYWVEQHRLDSRACGQATAVKNIRDEAGCTLREAYDSFFVLKEKPKL